MERMGDTPQNVMTNRAPAVLKSWYFFRHLSQGGESLYRHFPLRLQRVCLRPSAVSNLYFAAHALHFIVHCIVQQCIVHCIVSAKCSDAWYTKLFRFYVLPHMRSTSVSPWHYFFPFLCNLVPSHNGHLPFLTHLRIHAYSSSLRTYQ